MKRFLIIIILFTTYSCKKETTLYGKYTLYNDPTRQVEMIVMPSKLEIYKSGQLFGEVYYDGELIGSKTYFPADVWYNPETVVEWSEIGSFIECQYITHNPDTTATPYYPDKQYEMDWLKIE